MFAALASAKMTVDEFFAWADTQEGKYELDGGDVVAMAPERVVHVRLKFKIARAFADAIAAAGLPCEAFTEGLAVRIDRTSSYQPDVLVQCGEPLTDDEREATNPVVVVEVLSPSTAYLDLGRKARNYFRVPSVEHYLIVDPDEPLVTHHRRGPDGAVLTRTLADGTLFLDPPGVLLQVADLLPAGVAARTVE